ncbi:MAG: DUF3152 domain-containing protein [Dactylosporangium sp.]|nr:DUF3152 domain-containing protein [Dactylosporangium sp.]NNJ63813.1 DUF3152 domain-containing protein [Dactylosporangium sp.]
MNSSSVRLVVAILVAIVVGTLGGYGLTQAGVVSLAEDTQRASITAQRSDAVAAGVPSPSTPTTVAPSTVPSPETPTPADPADVPAAGSGDFTTVPGPSDRVGSSGRLVRYRVVVEAEAPIEPATFATAVERTLADPRGWTANGQWSFQRVDAGQAALTVHLATPQTTDTICGRYGLRTGGEVSCRGGPNVVINLKRWMLGVPWYADSLVDYRHMLVNHEIGHFLGHGHDYCPGPGQLAPVMQTQTIALKGCVRNPWPFPTE